jgi:cob(I)alamin adenosyltransferase
MTTPADTARTWREVADRLTPAQIAQLEHLERDNPQTLLEMARQWAAKNMTAAAPLDQCRAARRRSAHVRLAARQ